MIPVRFPVQGFFYRACDAEKGVTRKRCDTEKSDAERVRCRKRHDAGRKRHDAGRSIVHFHMRINALTDLPHFRQTGS